MDPEKVSGENVSTNLLTEDAQSEVDIPVTDSKPRGRLISRNRGSQHLPRMMTPILPNFPKWQMGQPLTLLSKQLQLQGPPRIMDLPKTPVQLSKDPNPWRPAGRWRKESDANPDEKQTDLILKQTRGILNKLTPENFDKLCDKFLKLELNDRQDRISAVIKVVFEKAIDEPNFSQAYAKMVKCVCLHSRETAKKFRKEILDQCQKEFQKTNRDEDEITQKEKDIQAAQDGKEKNELKLELDDFRTKMRRRSLGNVRFIGELFKLQMLTPKIVVDCVQMLIGNSDEESYECLCKLLTTVGQMLENALRDQELRLHDCKKRGLPIPKFFPEANYMDKTFKKLNEIASDSSRPPRTRCALYGVIQLREKKWVPPRHRNYPQTIDVVRRDAIREEQERERRNSDLPEDITIDSANPNLDALGNKKNEEAKIFQKYFCLLNPEDITLYVRDRLPGDLSLIFVDEVCRSVVGMETVQEQVGAGNLVRSLIQANVVQRDQVLQVFVNGILAQIPSNLSDSRVMCSHMATFFLATFIVTIFDTESSLDWLLELYQLLNKSEFHKTQTEFIKVTLNLLRSKMSVEHVRRLWTNCRKEDASSLCKIAPWLGVNGVLVTEMVQVLDQTEEAVELGEIFKAQSWNTKDVEVEMALLQAIMLMKMKNPAWNSACLEGIVFG